MVNTVTSDTNNKTSIIKDFNLTSSIQGIHYYSTHVIEAEIEAYESHIEEAATLNKKEKPAHKKAAGARKVIDHRRDPCR